MPALHTLSHKSAAKVNGRRRALRADTVVAAMMALAHKTRLAAFRLLVRVGPDGMSAGAIATRLGVRPSTLSHHLAGLERAGLLQSRRLRRQIFYACDYEGVRGVLEFLINDCCRGHPDLCGFVRERTRAARTS
jgi:ArsR family transcriptional regulator, arsenate/arsenite/antimonite-responsive transcriptional repressor